MKRMKSIFSLILALLTVFAMGTAVFAAGEGSITVDNAVDGKTYTIYRIFNLNDHNDDYSALNYKVNSKWSGFFAEGAKGLEYVEIDDQGYVTWIEGKAAADFAAEAIKYAEANSIEYDGQATAQNGKVMFDNLDLGYYLVQSDLGALCTLDTTTPDVTIKEKNSKPEINKEVEEDSTGVYGQKNDADIGQTVKFKTTITIKDGEPTKYVLHDKMSAGLTFRAEDIAALTVKTAEKTFAAGTDYSLVTEGLDDGCTFEIRFTDTALKPNDVVTVEYSAMVNENAVIAGEGNPNDTRLTYKDNGETEWDQTRTYVWEVNVFKYAKNENTEIPLKDAQFVMYKMVNGEKNYVVIDANNRVTGFTENAFDSAAATKASVFTTPESGKFSVTGLDADVYFLEETKAPAGYNTLKSPVKIEITRAYSDETNVGTATVTYGEAEGEQPAPVANPDVKVLNQTGAELPSTGGIGTTIFYIIGGLMVAGAIVFLVTKKRMGKSED